MTAVRSLVKFTMKTDRYSQIKWKVGLVWIKLKFWEKINSTKFDFFIF